MTWHLDARFSIKSGCNFKFKCNYTLSALQDMRCEALADLAQPSTEKPGMELSYPPSLFPLFFFFLPKKQKKCIARPLGKSLEYASKGAFNEVSSHLVGRTKLLTEFKLLGGDWPSNYFKSNL